MSPLIKNAVLAFVAGVVTSFAAFIAVTPDNPGKAALISAGAAALYAGGRALVGYLKATYGSAPFAVDTEAEGF
jgi:hypothetical protein